MIIEHAGKRPRIHESAYIAPTAVVCGDVSIGRNTRVLFGAVITAEGRGAVKIGDGCIIMENAVIRGSGRHETDVGDHVLVGPRAYLTGCAVEDEVFLATGATIFNGARIKKRAEVRINGVVHLKTVVPEDTVVPIGWVAVGDPAEILPPDDHEKIWKIQEPLNFPLTVFGLERPPAHRSIMPELKKRYAAALARHKNDVVPGRE